MTEQELKEKYSMFTDAWKFYRKWAVQQFPMTDQQWAQVVRESHEIHEKYGGSTMVEYMMRAVVNGLEEHERQVGL